MLSICERTSDGYANRENSYQVQPEAHGCYVSRPLIHFPFNHLSRLSIFSGPCYFCKHVQFKLNRFELLLISPDSNISLATSLKTLEFNLLYTPDSVQELGRIVKACIQKFSKLERIIVRIEFKTRREFPHGRWIRLLDDFLGTKGTCLDHEKIYGSKAVIVRWSWDVKGRAIGSSAEEGKKVR